jgi:hypothetical protein
MNEAMKADQARADDQTVPVHRMDPEVKARWIAALRSGEYKQGCDVLRTLNDEFCCLGVLCDLYAKEHGINWTGRQWGTSGGACVLADLGGFYYPPDAVREWASFHEDKQLVSIGELTTSLPAHNDGRGRNAVPRTFAEIADAIEAQL